MITCIAVDDEPLALSLLKDNIRQVPFLHLAACCNDSFEAAKAMMQHAVDLVFIDIQMPGLTGLQFVESLAYKPLIILITAYKQYALDGYSLDVVDYLMKPVPMDRFMKACNKARVIYELKQAHKNPEDRQTADYFFINVDYSMIKVEFADLVWIEGLRDYIKIHLKSTTNPLVSRMGIKTIEDLLPPAKFIRIHKSYLVSIAHIKAVRKSSVFINNHELPIGETYRDKIAILTGKQA